MKQLLSDLLQSKKFVVFVTSLLVAFIMKLAVRFNIGIDNDLATYMADRVVAAASAYLIGQGLADHGKEATKLELKVEPTPPQPPST